MLGSTAVVAMISQQNCKLKKFKNLVSKLQKIEMSMSKSQKIENIVSFGPLFSFLTRHQATSAMQPTDLKTTNQNCKILRNNDLFVTKKRSVKIDFFFEKLVTFVPFTR